MDRDEFLGGCLFVFLGFAVLDNKTIYVPTEANLPILEAGKR